MDGWIGLVILFAVAGWLACMATAASMGMRRGLAHALVALVLGLVAGPVALLWARTQRGPQEPVNR